MPDHSLKTRVQTEMIAAMKAGDKARTQVVRMLLSEIKAKEADDVNADATETVAGYAKKLRKTMAEMEKLNQPTHVEQIKAELVIVDEFLPKQMDDLTLERISGEVLAPMGTLAKKDMGRAIGAIMKAVAATGGSADAGKVRAWVESKIPV